MRRGGVYWINLEPASPPDMRKVRPAIIVSNTGHNERLDSVVVIPLSTRVPEIWPLRLKLPLRGLRDSYAVLPGVRQVSKARLHELVTQASSEALGRLTAALFAYLGD